MTLRIALVALLLGCAAAAQVAQAGNPGCYNCNSRGCANCGRGGCANCGHHGLGGHHNGRHDLAARQNPSLLNWHGNYYHVKYGAPVALVVPPTASTHTEFGWGVGTTRVSPIYPQFGRSFPGQYYGGQAFLPTPAWPSDTNQFGVYYVRGPW